MCLCVSVCASVSARARAKGALRAMLIGALIGGRAGEDTRLRLDQPGGSLHTNTGYSETQPGPAVSQAASTTKTLGDVTRSAQQARATTDVLR